MSLTHCIYRSFKLIKFPRAKSSDKACIIFINQSEIKKKIATD